MKNLSLTKIALIFFLFLSLSTLLCAKGLVSLNPSDCIQDLKVKISGESTPVTIFRGAGDLSEKYFYLVNSPHILLKDGKPKFRVHYWQDKTNESQCLAKIDFSLDLKIPVESISGVSQEVEKYFQGKKAQTFIASKLLTPDEKKSFDEAGRLTPLPVRVISATAFNMDEKGSSIKSFLKVSTDSTVIPVEVQMELDKANYEGFFQAFKDGKVGLPLLLSLEYDGASAPSTATVEINFDAARKLFSSNKTLFSDFTKAALNPKDEKNLEVINELVNQKAIKIISNSPEKDSSQLTNDAKTQLLFCILKNLFVSPSTPLPTQVPTPSPNLPHLPHFNFKNLVNASPQQALASLKVQDAAYNLIDLAKSPKGTCKLNLDTIKRVVCQTSMGILISCKNFPPTVFKDKKPFELAEAYFVLPAMSDAIFKTVKLDASLLSESSPEKPLAEETTTWTSEKGQWTKSKSDGSQEEEANSLFFPIGKIIKQGKNKKDFFFKFNWSFETKQGNKKNYSSKMSCFEGDAPISTPANLFVMPEISFMAPFVKDTDEAKDSKCPIESASFVVKESVDNSERKFAFNSKADLPGGNFQILLFDSTQEKPNKVSIKGEIKLKNGKTIPFPENTDDYFKSTFYQNGGVFYITEEELLEKSK
ncbi:MAG: hypothetical protein HQM08_15795 [Candidatus Riflebacteria bacterium]|nr:hypothetical protein [Candidatus Riflebacteria bacterium]